MVDEVNAAMAAARKGLGEAKGKPDNAIDITMNAIVNKMLATPTPEVKPVSVQEALKAKSPEALIMHDGKPMLTKGAFNVITGGAKMGKTTFVSWLLSEVSKNQVKCILYDTEQGEIGIKTYMMRYKAHTGSFPGESVEMFNLVQYKKDHATLMGILAKDIRDKMPEVVFYDNFQQILGDMNDVNEISTLCSEFQNLCNEFKVTIVVIMHNKKSGDKPNSAMYGFAGSELERAVSGVILDVHKEHRGDDYARVTTLMSRYGQDYDFGQFKFNEVEVFNDQNESLGHLAICDWQDIELNQEQSKKASSKSQKEVIYDTFKAIFGEKHTLRTSDIEKGLNDLYQAKRGKPIQRSTMHNQINDAKRLGILTSTRKGFYDIISPEEKDSQIAIPFES